MKLIYRISLRLSMLLIPLMALWATLFYFAMVDEINDEADDSLENYSEVIIIRMLSGQQLPETNEGSNNSYSITPVSGGYAAINDHIKYHDAEVYIPEKQETEPARILTTIFVDAEGLYYELKVATPTFEKDDLLSSILGWVVLLYVILLLTVIAITIWIFQRNLRPLYALLEWLDEYIPGRNKRPVPNDTKITEFQKLNIAMQQAVNRSEELYASQQQFIGNASHELQTPLAVLSNRLEWMLNNTNLSEEQVGEVFKMRVTLNNIVRLNKTLLLLTKIENDQFPEVVEVDIVSMAQGHIDMFNDIYEHRNITCILNSVSELKVLMNESLASVLVANLIKNAYIHGEESSLVEVVTYNNRFVVSNQGSEPLEVNRIFDRFYQGSKKGDSTGLGLALVGAVCKCYGLAIDYSFEQGRHIFTVMWKYF